MEGILRLGTRLRPEKGNLRPQNEGETAPWDAAAPEGWGAASLDEAAPGDEAVPP